MMHDFSRGDQPRTTLPAEDMSISDLAFGMSRMGFQAGQLGQSLEVWDRMLRDEVTIFLGLAGAMVPAGLQEMISYLISHRLVDCVVSTGANLFHDLCEGLGVMHYRGDCQADDARLKECRIDRIYDVFVSEEELHKADLFISDLVKRLPTDRTYSSRELMEMIGRDVPASTILGAAQRADIPVFVPALSDSSIGIGMVIARREGHPVLVDQIQDVDEITQITEKSEKTGVVFIGGGVPKNFIQQTKVIAELMGNYRGGHNYAIQYTTDNPHFGGLSGCTFSEAVSWGKVDRHARMVQVFSDATITVPLVVQALRERRLKRPSVPCFRWTESELELKYQRL
ncbi:MAG: putative deoxyhypusine synthase [Methanosaeta sp. PtaB.Bin039]|nr:MAG: putative deoxyhypusine synthase [Methanosaeta sp. PtaB.Bin039]